MKRVLTLLGVLLLAQLTYAQCANMVAGIGASINNMTVQFTNTSTNSSLPPVVKTSVWSFGDGSSSTSLNPLKTYTTAGTYSVSMINTWFDTLNSAILCIDTAYTTVTVPGSGPANNEISGMIFWDTTGGKPVQAAFKVWLIVYDSATQMLTAVDSTNTGGVLSANYTFLNAATGVYLVKAAQTGGGTTNPPVFMPTYHDSSLYWHTAQYIGHTGGLTLAKHIWMKGGNPGTGPGFIGGNVSQGANKGTGGGIAGMQIFLRNAANGVVRATVTNGNGDYSFSNLPAGSYNIYPEHINYTTVPSGALTVTAAQPNVTGVDFERTNSNMTIRLKSLSVGKLPATDLFSIYPNPSAGTMTINWKNGVQGDAAIAVLDISGRTVLSTTVSMNQPYQLSASHLQQGIYFVKIAAGNGQHTEKIVISK
jgi:PKD repeat protein